jgi:hypothetical protein
MDGRRTLPGLHQSQACKSKSDGPPLAFVTMAKKAAAKSLQAPRTLDFFGLWRDLSRCGEQRSFMSINRSHLTMPSDSSSRLPLPSAAFVQ